MQGTPRSDPVKHFAARCLQSDRATPTQNQHHECEQDQQVEDDHTSKAKKPSCATLRRVDVRKMGAQDRDGMVHSSPVNLSGKARMLHHLLGLRDDLTGTAREAGQAAASAAQLFGECPATDAKTLAQQQFQLRNIAVYFFRINHFAIPMAQSTATGGDPQ